MASSSSYKPPYTPLSDRTVSAGAPANHRRSLKFVSSITLLSLLCVVLSILVVRNHSSFPKSELLKDGTSQQSSPPLRAAGDGVWTNRMLSWQRTAFHFQPPKSWMNDPNGPLYHKGWYHLFYQYNPSSAVWMENMTWGHAVSRDMIRWLHLPYAMLPDQPYDLRGVFTGSATTLPDGQIMMLYTGNTNVQVQNLAYPANLSDPLLLKWIKYSGNPVIVPPPGIGLMEFRDPSSAWAGLENGQWFISIGAQVGKTGVAFVYETTDFKSYKLLDGFLHSVPGTGMWECVDFYPILTGDEIGSDSSNKGLDVKHVLKVSLYDEGHDYYAIGTYDPIKNKWVPDFPELDIGHGLRFDYGNYYASKAFYDQNKNRRILLAWIAESDPQDVDLLKGWASLQGIPRTLHLDKKTGSHLLQWPIEEVESLRSGDPIVTHLNLQPGQILPIHIPAASQLDISAWFEVDEEALEGEGEGDFRYNCSSSGGAVKRGALGPFGLVVGADETLAELTPIYFYVQKGGDGKAKAHFCTDLTRSSEASGVTKEVYGNSVPVIDDEKYSARILVDHSIVESFGQGGRTVITSRIYPTKAIYEAARVFLFNNATGTSVKASVKIWQMNSADIKPFPF
ncbi:PREDICTED: acid beta-fructofuranosidase AIV-18-like isoform X1 [Ipomoea nil]|uniref:acid beta-fructofuranosidase AIV-18-like isoform X1 n=1 Tax=Ipomoea nil TaxID=35883 RepID=UPI000900FDE9|nr:PREDICTED: acid beta-fructofuranosidase AIV-18-like isoform X1 [Ipomoea nil]